MNDVNTAVLKCVDSENSAVTLTQLIGALPQYAPDDLKLATRELFEDGKIQRLSVYRPEKNYFVFYSLYVKTTKGYERPDDVAPPAPPVLVQPQVDFVPTAEQVMDAIANLTSDQAVAVLERCGWVPEPDAAEPVVVEVDRRTNVIDRRRLTALDVINRWRLAYPLARVVEIIGESRKRGVSRGDAAIAIRMIREQVRESTPC